MADLLTERVKRVKAITTATRTADANGAGIDRQGYNDVTFVVSVGASGDTLSGSVYAELELEHSDDDSSYSDCADADIKTAVTGTNTGTFAKIDDGAEDDAIYSVDYVGSKRYVRLVYNITGTHSNGMPVGAIALLGQARSLPAA